MNQDIAPELLEKVQNDFEKRLNANRTLKILQSKIEKETATWQDAQKYSIEVGRLLSQVFKDNLSSDILPDGKMYYNIANRVLPPPIKKAYAEAANYAGKVQAGFNKKAGLGLKNITHSIRADRVSHIVDLVSGKNKFDDIAYMLGNPVVNLCQSAVDMTIKANADFHYSSGLKPTVTRYTDGTCCDWCSEVAGEYTYPDVPKDVYRRHKNCNCVVVYDPADGGKVKDVHTKNEYNSVNEAVKTEYAKRTKMMSSLKKDPEKLKTVGLEKSLTKNPQEIIENIENTKNIEKLTVGSIIKSKGKRGGNESDLVNQTDKQIKKGIRSISKQIEKHKDKISNPKDYIPNWNESSSKIKRGLIKHWQHEIDNFEKSIEKRIYELERRSSNE